MSSYNNLGIGVQVADSSDNLVLPVNMQRDMTGERHDRGQVRVMGSKLRSYELDDSPADACQSLQLAH